MSVRDKTISHPLFPALPGIPTWQEIRDRIEHQRLGARVFDEHRVAGSTDVVLGDWASAERMADRLNEDVLGRRFSPARLLYLMLGGWLLELGTAPRWPHYVVEPAWYSTEPEGE